MGIKQSTDWLYGQAIGTSKEKNKLVKANDPTLDFYTGTGDPTQSPLYNSFLSKARESIGSTYDTAMTNVRSNANARGFGYASPLEQTAETGVRAAGAGALSAAPREAALDVIQPQLAATQIRSGEAGLYDPTKYTGDITQLQIEQQKAKSALIGNLTGLATSLISPFAGQIAGKLFQGGSSAPGT